jgi:prepilin-type processing-associated H-X9-DG protein
MISRQNNHTGLTILELLVAVSVVAVLAALLLPAILQARASARRTACVSNLRQWTLAVHLYADTHAGRLPYRGQGVQPTTLLNRPDDWFNALPPLMENEPYSQLAARGLYPRVGQSSVWMCPDAELMPPTANPKSIPPNYPIFFAYAMNMALSTPFNGRPDHIAKVRPLQTMVFMAEGPGPYCSVLPRAKPYSPIARHTGRTVNIAFLDGRVESLVGDEVGCGIGDPERPEICWMPHNSRWQPPSN